MANATEEEELIDEAQQENHSEKKIQKDDEVAIKSRYVFAAMFFFANFNHYILRNNINVAIVAMVNSTAMINDVSPNTSTNAGTVCPNRNNFNQSDSSKEGPFEWDTIDQGLVLGCYFYGYVLSGIPGAWLSRKLGFRIVVGVAFILSSIFTILTPFAAWYKFEMLIALRVALGLVQGAIIPSLVGGVGVWSPPDERTTMFAIPSSGCLFGIVFVFPVGGLISKYLSWEYVFFITGTAVLLWTILWFVLVFDSPSTHPRIEESEKKYILQSLGCNSSNKKTEEDIAVPWKAILSSPQVFAILAAHFACNWGDYTLQAMLPTYMATIQNFDLASSGALSSLPFICQVVVIMSIGPITDAVLKKNWLTVLGARKVNTAVSLMIPALFTVLAGYSGCDAVRVVAYFCLASGIIGVSCAGVKANNVDIAPKLSGIVCAYTNTIANICGFASPQAVSLLLETGNNLENWQKVFWLCAGINVAGTIAFTAFAGGKELKWATQDSSGSDENANSKKLIGQSDSTKV